MLIEGAPEVIKEDMLKEWASDVRKISDGITLFEMKAAFLMMKEFEKGISFEEAEKEIYDKDLDVSGSILYRIVRKIVRFSKHGTEYGEYWNNNYYSRIGIKKHF